MAIMFSESDGKVGLPYIKNNGIINPVKEEAYSVRRWTIMAWFTNCWQSKYSKNLRTIIH
jgi:hypothetical protein